jgi:NTP pyrophosphatase (non-canonical NTP hydrolase)
MGPDKLPEAITALVDLVARLRGPGGCPWDAKQTDATIKIYLLEEAYEVLEAVERFSPEEICAELGDLLFQILFLARLAEERGDYDFTDVVETITAKMIRRRASHQPLRVFHTPSPPSFVPTGSGSGHPRSGLIGRVPKRFRKRFKRSGANCRRPLTPTLRSGCKRSWVTCFSASSSGCDIWGSMPSTS